MSVYIVYFILLSSEIHVYYTQFQFLHLMKKYYVKSGQTWHWIGYLYLYVQQVKSILLFQKMFTTRKWLGRISSRVNWKKSNSFKIAVQK